MKKSLILLIILSAVTLSSAFSQGLRADRIESEKIAFFTKRLTLTADEAEKFWPVYNDYTSRRDKLNQDRNSLGKYLNQNYSNLSDKELIESSDRLIEYDTQLAMLSKEYHEKFKAILSPSQVIKLYYAEIQFKTLLLNQLQQQRGQRTLPPARRNELIKRRPV